MTNSENVSNSQIIRRIAVLHLPILPAVAAAMILDDHLPPLMIWGGSKCEVVNGVKGCFGYLPAGLVVLLLVSTVASWPIIKRMGDFDE